MTNPTDLTKQPGDSSSSPQTPSGSINVNPTLTNQLISINASAQAPIKLTPFNYQIWYTQWYSLLIGYDFLNFVEQDRKTEATGNSFLFRQDQFIRSALIASLSPEVAPFVVGDKTSYDVWQSLSKMYAKPSQSRIMSLREQLLTITKGSLTISEYLQKAKSISFQLETAGVSVSAAEFALSVFLGLPSDYKEITAALRARDNVVSFDELHEKLTDVETQLNRDSNVVTNQVSINYTQNQSYSGGTRNNHSGSGKQSQNKNSNNSGSTGNRGRIVCQFCEKPGHTTKQCWKLKKACPWFFSNSQTSKPQVNFAEQSANSKWLLDSGANQHVTQDIQNLSLHSEYDGGEDVMLGDGMSHPVTHTGSVSFSTPTRNLMLNDVFCVPAINRNLISVHKFCDTNDVEVYFNSFSFGVKDMRTGKLLAKGEPKNGLYEWPPVFSKSKSNLIVSHTVCTSQSLWHRRLGHPSAPVIRFLLKSLNKSSMSVNDSFHCESCKCNKMHKVPFSESSVTSSAPLELLYSDVWGPAPVCSMEGFKYYLIIVDHFTKYVWLFPLKKKSEVSPIFSVFKRTVEKYFKRSIISVYSDNGGEFVSLKPFFQEHGITHFLTPPYTPEHNATAERRHRHIVETGMTMLHLANLPLHFWPHAFLTAVYLINRMPTRVINNVSPFQKLHGTEPNYLKLRVFGSLCYPWLRPYNSTKLQSKSSPCVFLGYSTNQSAYKCMDVKTSRIYVTRHVQFVENVFPFQNFDTQSARPTESTLDSWIPLHFVIPISSNNAGMGSVQQLAFPSPTATLEHHSPHPNTENLEPESSGMKSASAHAQDTTPLSVVLPSSATVADSQRQLTTVPMAPQNTHPMVTRGKNNIVKPVQRLCLNAEKANDSLLVVPKTVSQALKIPQWRAAMDEEYDALQRQKTWTLVPKSMATNVVSCKWIFRIKYDSDGKPIRNKARLVARGFTQRPGLDYDQTFSPVAKHPTIRILLSIAVTNDWPLRQVDINNAFLHGHLTETVFMEQPAGYVDSNDPTAVCRLHKSLYGLKQAPRVWYSELKNYLINSGFAQSHSDTCLFTYIHDRLIIYVLVYVDDIIITGNKLEAVEKFISQLKSNFSVKDLGDLSYFLGVEVKRLPTGIFLSQQNYIREILEFAKMEGAKAVNTPLSTSSTLRLADSVHLDDVSSFRRVIGKLQYLLLTRPDIAFAVNRLSQFTSRPTINHWSAVKRLLRFLIGTFDTGLFLRRDSKCDLHAFSDADWAGNPDDRTSTSANIIFLGRNPIAWSSKKQKSVARSSTEAEYKSVASTSADVTWVRNLLAELQVNISSTPVIYCDNLSATYVAANPVFHSRMKHIAVDYHFVRSQVQNGSLRVTHVSSKEQLADLLTKALSTQAFNKWCDKIGISSRSAILREGIRR